MDNKEKSQPKDSKLTRRRFLQGTTATAATIMIAPRHVLGGMGYTAPSDKLNIAGIGVGGMGKNNLTACQAENIVALCDVDDAYSVQAYERFPTAKRYRDYRNMLEKQKDIDAIVIATPDHSHAVIAMAAMQLGKHVYVQKPMTHSVYEARKLTEAARKYKVVTQMGNQGPVREVHAWTNRPVWPQGVEVDRPADTPPIPDTLDWDLWLGPAQYRPYHPTYLPESWRAWWDFGTGSLGDLGCHILDAAFWALKMKYPESVEGNISTYWCGFWEYTEPKNENYPRSTIVRYKFPAREDMPPATLTWWDGGLMPPRPEELEEGRRMGDEDGGLLFIGDKGKLMAGCYGKSPRLIPETKMQEYQIPAPSIERILDGISGHERDWVRACKGGKPASSNFDFSGPLSEMVLMGNLAVRFPNRRLLWDGINMQVTNNIEANAYVKRQYREGWSL
jgi:hypothetical protein